MTAVAISETLDAIVNRFFVHGTVATMPTVRFTADDAVLVASDLDALRSRTAASTVGLEHSNVLDESLRRSRETKDVRLEPWPELDAILRQIASELNLNWTLAARVHKLIIYEAGSFFREHRDAEHCPGHMISLIVDLDSNAEGGVVVFGHERNTLAGGRAISNVPKARERETWHSRTGAWAAWFASTRHSVSKLKSGHRVVLALDVIATPPPPSTAALFPARRMVGGGVPPFAELVWRHIAEHLPPVDLCALSRTCRGLHTLLGSAPALLASFFQRAVPPALRSSKDQISVGFVCRNEYLFNTADDNTVVPTWQLKGRDRLVAEALRLCGWRVTVRRVRLLDEVSEHWRRDGDDDSDSDGGHGPINVLDRVRIGCMEIDRDALDDLRHITYRFQTAHAEGSALLQTMQARIEHFDKIEHTRHELNAIRATCHDEDGERAFLVVPFVGVLWCESLASLPAVPALQAGEQERLWGNESTFGERTYAACAVIAHVLDASEVEGRLSWSDDITRPRNH